MTKDWVLVVGHFSVCQILLHCVVVAFHPRLRRISKPKHTRLKFDLEKLKELNVFETFQAMIGGKFAPLTNYE